MQPKKITLKEAQKKGKLEKFIKEHQELECDEQKLNKALVSRSCDFVPLTY